MTKNYPKLFERVYNTPLAIHPDKLTIIENVFRGHVLQMDGFAIEAKQGFSKPSIPSYGQTDGIAVIPIHGTLVQRTGGMDALSGLTSYQSIRSDLNQALNDEMVKAIMLDIDSSGGEVAGLFDLVDAIKEANTQKPIWAIANEAAFSAAYAIASACERILMPRTASLGSIGVIAMHLDQSEKDAKDGYRYTAIHAGANKADGNPHFGDVGSIGQENLIAGDFPRHTDTVILAKGQNLKAGSVLGQVTETGEYLLSAKAAQDGSQTPSAVLQVDADASEDAIRAPVWFSGCFNEDALSFGKDHDKLTSKAALRSFSIFLKSVVGA